MQLYFIKKKAFCKLTDKENGRRLITNYFSSAAS
jgi:hypothetical protein